MQESLEKMNLPLRNAEESNLVNLAYKISDRGVERSANNLTDKIAGNIYNVIEAGFPSNHPLSIYASEIFGEEGKQIYQQKGLVPYLENINKFSSVQNEEGLFHAALSTKKDRAGALERQISQLGELGGKELSSYTIDELKTAEKIIRDAPVAKRTIDSVMEVGEIAAKIMRFKI
jgi:hypothetical protein